MSRKRLGRIDPEAASRARDAAEQAAPVRPQAGPPIARMAAGVGQEIDTEIRRLRTELEALTAATTDLKTAEAEGRVILAVDLDQIDTGHLTRDRRVLNREGEDWTALKTSLAARGQQTPIELSDLGEDANPRYGLISGLRRVSALRELLEETGEDRFALVLALIRPAEATPQKLIAMIEENEVRSGISFFERGRIAAMAAGEGIFKDADHAVEALFASSSRNRRYKIRCFVTVYETLGERLAYPEAIGERLGIALAKAIREGAGPEMTMTLDGYPERSETQELAILNNIVRGGLPGLEISARGRNAEPVMQASWKGAGKMKVRARSRTGSNRVTLDIEGLSQVDEASLQKLVRWMADQLEDTVKTS